MVGEPGKINLNTALVSESMDGGFDVYDVVGGRIVAYADNNEINLNLETFNSIVNGISSGLIAPADVTVQIGEDFFSLSFNPPA